VNSLDLEAYVAGLQVIASPRRAAAGIVRAAEIARLP
jgi:hypothetical protein